MSDAVSMLRQAARELQVQAEHEQEMIPDGSTVLADLGHAAQAIGFYAAAIAVEAVACALEWEREAA